MRISQQNKARCLLGGMVAGKALWFWRVEQLSVGDPLTWAVGTVESAEDPSGGQGEMPRQCTLPQTHRG